MPHQRCDRRSEVSVALSDGQWRNELLEHALDCEACSTLWITDCLAERARGEITRPLPLNADVLWWKAQLRASRVNSTRAIGPIIGAQAIAIAGGAVALFAVLAALRTMFNGQPLSSTSMQSLGTIAVLLFAFLLSITKGGMAGATSE